MRPRLIAIFLLLVLAPLALLAWLGFRTAADEKSRVQSTISNAYTNQLNSLRSLINETVTDQQRQLSTLLTQTDTANTTALRKLARTQRFVRQVFVIDSAGKFTHPPPDDTARTDAEREFLQRTNSIWQSGERFITGAEILAQNIAPPDQGAYSQAVQNIPATSNTFTTGQGWYTWFHGDGVRFIFWQYFPTTDQTTGIELDREALLAEVIAELPSDTGTGTGTVVLTDASARPIYQWGGTEPAPEATPDASIALYAPLGMWQLNHYANGTAVSTQTKLLPLIITVASAALALLALAIYFYRENSRDMRIAAEKVSFVNQVSHELKTPLTNIRMYAELAEEKLPPDEENGAKRCLDIVVNESQRLSRLISNVLTFAKPKFQEPNPTPNIPDNLIQETLDHFRPALDAQNIKIETTLDAKTEVKIDADILEQILGNLLSNVEKYATTGKSLKITSTQDTGITTITVSDNGPGIPRNQREKIFQPFHRLSNRNSDGVSGTGIGLTIARDLARKHNGDLTLTDSNNGCTFTLTLRTHTS